MEEDSKSNSTQILQNTNNTQKTKIVFFASVVGLMLLTFVIGYFLGSRFSNPSAVQPAEPRNPDTRVLVDPTEILSNPIFVEWYGALKGRVVSKTDNSFTVDFEGNSLEIFVQPAITRIVDMTTDPENPSILTLDELPLNSMVEGSVTISKGTLTGDLNQKVVANGFSVTAK